MAPDDGVCNVVLENKNFYRVVVLGMLKVNRRRNESFEALFRRFNRRVQLSGRLLDARKIRFFAKDPNKTSRKASALRRLEVSAKREYLLKTGQLVEEENQKGAKKF